MASGMGIDSHDNANTKAANTPMSTTRRMGNEVFVPDMRNASLTSLNALFILIIASY